MQAHVFSYLTAPRSVGATPLPLRATTDFLALATTCSSAWAIYSAGREALWRSALSHRVKVRGPLSLPLGRRTPKHTPRTPYRDRHGTLTLPHLYPSP